MAKGGVNKVILVGNVGAEPETRYLPNGGAVATVSLATSESWKDKQTGQMQERTEWHRVVFFNRLAEIVTEHIHKGYKLYIEGSLRTRKWQDQNGNDRWSTEIVAADMLIIDGKKDGGKDFDQDDGQDFSGEYNEPAPVEQPAPRAASRNAPASRPSNNSNNAQGSRKPYARPERPAPVPAGDFEDDIPFNKLGKEAMV